MTKWKPVWGFSDYSISDTGIVVSRKSGNVIEQEPGRDGCTTVILFANSGTPMIKKVCRLVVDSFDWVSEGYTPIYHLDGDKSNDTLENLRRAKLVPEPSRYIAETEPVKLEPKVPKKPKPIPRDLRMFRARNDTRPVRVIQTGQVYPSKAALCREFGLDPATVSHMLKGDARNKTHHGMTFEYVDDTRPFVRVVETGEVYRTVHDISLAFTLDPSAVRKVLKGQQRSTGGMTLEWVQRDDPSLKNVKILNSEKEIRKLKLRNIRHPQRPIRIVETKQVFASQSAAARAIGGRQSYISQCLLGGANRTHMGYHFEYAD